jgi:hypothetical protein
MGMGGVNRYPGRGGRGYMSGVSLEGSLKEVHGVLRLGEEKALRVGGGQAKQWLEVFVMVNVNLRD